MDYDLLTRLVIGSYLFTAAITAAGAKAFHYLYRLMSNHIEHRLKRIEEELGIDPDEK